MRASEPETIKQPASKPSSSHQGTRSLTDGVADPVTIGAYQKSGTDIFDGLFAGAVDDAAYYTAALTDQQIAAIYGAPDGECL